MKFDITFSVTAVCAKYYADNSESSESLSTTNITLNLDKNIAANFLFRFAPSAFKLDDETKVILRYDKMNNLIGICIFRDQFVYIVKNMNQVLAEILEGFMRIRTTEKITSIMEFDFETASNSYELDENNIPDEFDS